MKLGFIDTLYLIIIVLKFCGVITWPWWIILAPAIFIIILLIIVGIAALKKDTLKK